MPLPGDFRDATAQNEEEAKIVDIDLSVARAFPGVEFRVSGRYVVTFPQSFALPQVDPNRVTTTIAAPGVCFISAGAQGKAPLFIQPGTIYRLGAFDRLFVMNAAQAGKTLRLYVTVNPMVDIAAPPLTISGTVAVDGMDGPEGASRAYLAGPAALATQLFSTAANVNGVILRTAVLDTTATHRAGFLSGTVAPADVNDTASNHLLQTLSGYGVLPFPVKIPAGRGLWACQDAVSVSAFGASWDIL